MIQRSLQPLRPHRTAAFSLIETAIVIVIMGTVAAIAIPRLASATDNASDASTQASIAALERAITFYAAEHEDRSPAEETDGKVNTDSSTFVGRLVLTSDVNGDWGTKFMFGPYVSDVPFNRKNGLRRIRIDGDPAGANTHGWRFDSATRVIEPDDPEQAAARAGVSGKPGATGGSVSAVAAEAVKIE